MTSPAGLNAILLGGVSHKALITPVFQVNLLAGVLPSQISFSRAGNAMQYDSTGKLTYAPNNLLTQSATPSNAAWQKLNQSVSGNTVTATSTSGGYLYVTKSLTGENILSFDVVAGTAPFIAIDAGISTDTYAWFNTSTWTAATVQAGLTASVTPLGGGVYRLAVAFTANGSSENYSISTASADNTFTQVVGQTFVMNNAALAQVTYETTPRPQDQVITTSAAYYGPRFDFDPSTLAAKGLLIEEARTNLLLQSQSLTNAAWTVYQSAIASTSATSSPDGTNDAFMLLAGSGSGTIPAIYPTSLITTTSATNYAISIYAKAGTARYLAISSNSTVTNYISAVYDLQSGTSQAATQTSVGASSGTIVSATQTYLGNGWYRLILVGSYTGVLFGPTFTIASSGTGNTFSTSGNPIYPSASGTESVYLFGAQLELGSFATSYVPTNASSVTRAADVPGTNAPLTGYLAAGRSIWQVKNYTTGAVARADYAAGGWSWPADAWIQSMAVYNPSVTSAYTGAHLTVNGPY